MRIDFFRLTRLIFQIQNLLSAKQSIPKGDAGLYLLLRSICEQLESTNSGIAAAAGFDYSVLTLQNLPAPPPRMAGAREVPRENN